MLLSPRGQFRGGWRGGQLEQHSERSQQQKGGMSERDTSSSVRVSTLTLDGDEAGAPETSVAAQRYSL